MTNSEHRISQKYSLALRSECCCWHCPAARARSDPDGPKGAGNHAQQQLKPKRSQRGLVYGLPIVMNYAVMYEGFIDKTSSQYKTTFNQIYNEARVFTYQDTAVVTPNSDTPYSFLWADLRAEPLVISVPAVEKGRYFSVQFCDGNTFNYGYIGSRATGNDAAIICWPGRTGTAAHAPRHQESISFDDRILSLVLFAAVVRCGRLGERDEDPIRLPGASALGLSPASYRPPRGHQLPADQCGHGEKEFLPVSRLHLAVRARPDRKKKKKSAHRLARIGIGAGKTFHASTILTLNIN